ncbi:hypothetical protein [Smaragdicoccus niigatensis]|uniref:hypothetical protein n=1 Tax=Smaragdicoccus niigatensis TaxID=359359 RepID=UPI00037ED865|nr:hypothetical protein [Smaragdicoccus niigatensis]
MGALSDPDSFQPYVVEETPQQVTTARKNLEKTLGISIPVWPHERALYEQHGRAVPTD